jgi:hypothetical protein
MVFNRMALEGESTNKVKFQTVPARTVHERSPDPADSGKKVLPGVERFRSRIFFGIRGLAQRRGSTFLPVSKTFSTKRFPRNTERVIGEYRDKGNVLRGGVVQSFDMPRIIFCTKVKFYSIKLSIHSFIIPNVFSRNSSVVSGRIGHIRNAR